MYTGFVAEHPRQFVDVHFDYLDIYEMARVIFSSHVLDIESDDSSDKPRGARIRRSGHIQEHWSSGRTVIHVEDTPPPGLKIIDGPHLPSATSLITHATNTPTSTSCPCQKLDLDSST